MKKQGVETEEAGVLTKRALVLRISERTGFVQMNVGEVLQQTLDGIVEALGEGKRVEFRDFGVFEITNRKERIGRNPKKPEQTVVIPAHKAIKFKPGKDMRTLVATK